MKVKSENEDKNENENFEFKHCRNLLEFENREIE